MLIRALEPTQAWAEMRRRRHRDADLELCSGPGKLTEALGVGLDSNGADLSSDPFLILPRRDGWGGEIVTGPRVGITKAVERPGASPSPAFPTYPDLRRADQPGAAAPPLLTPPLDSGAASSGVASGATSVSGAASVSGAGASSGADSSGSE